MAYGVSAGSLAQRLVAGTPQVDAWMARYARTRDLPPEGATREELLLLPDVRQRVLATQGWAEAPDDWRAYFFVRGTLLRFLRGRGGDVEKAATMICDALRWYEEERYWDNWLRAYEVVVDPAHKQLLRRYSPEGYFGKDRRGAPVYYCRLGLKDSWRLIEQTSFETYVGFFCWTMEANIDKWHQACGERGVHLIGGNIVLDCADINIYRAIAPVGTIIWIVDNVLKDHFPEYAKNIFIVNAPWYFTWAWTFISPFVPEDTRKKIAVCGFFYMQQLTEHIAPEEIPAFLGGRSSETWPHGEGGDLPEDDGRGEVKKLNVYRRESVTMDVPAGMVCTLEFCVEERDVDVWAFAVSAAVAGPATSAGDVESVIFERQRLPATAGWQSECFQARPDIPAQVTLVFDNSHSWFKSKDVSYRFIVEPPAEEPASVLPEASASVLSEAVDGNEARTSENVDQAPLIHVQ